MCTNFPPNPSSQVVHNCHLILKEKKTHQIRHHMLNTLAPKFGSYDWAPHGTASQNQAMPNQQKQNPTSLECDVYACYFGTHGSGHHPILVDTFLPT